MKFVLLLYLVIYFGSVIWKSLSEFKATENEQVIVHKNRYVHQYLKHNGGTGRGQGVNPQIIRPTRGNNWSLN